MSDKTDQSRLVVRGDVLTATFLLINITIGTGILTMPYIMKQAGLGLGILLVIITLFITAYTLNLIIHCAHIANTYTYPGLMTRACGKVGFVVTAILQATFPYLVSIQELIIIGENSSDLARMLVTEEERDVFYVQDYFLSGLVLLTLITPLSMLRDITSLATWSVASIGTIIFTVIIVIIRYATLDLEPTPGAFTFAGPNIPNAVGMLNGVFTSHYSAMIIYNSIKHKSEDKWSYVVAMSIITFGGLYLTFGIVGYATFTGNTAPDIFHNYCPTDVLIDVGRFLFIVMIALTYPLQLFAVRQAIELSIFANYQPTPLYRHVMMTLFILGTTYGMSVICNCVDFVASLNGDIAGTCISNILPAVAALRLQKNPIFSVDNIPLWLLVVYGVTMLTGGTFLDILGIIDGTLCSEDTPPDICPSDNVTVYTDNVTLVTI